VVLGLCGLLRFFGCVGLLLGVRFGLLRGLRCLLVAVLLVRVGLGLRGYLFESGAIGS